jgi:putative ABC transport system ATP-binding protein
MSGERSLARNGRRTLRVRGLDGEEANMPGHVLEVENVTKRYGGARGGSATVALDGVSFYVDESEFVGIMGPSGSGKSTLLNCISTIDTLTDGAIRIAGRDITLLKSKELAQFRRDQLGFVFQDSNLLDTLTVRENIALALTIQKVPTREIPARVDDMAQRLGIAEVLDKYPYQISGGQKQRAAAARAVITRPSLVLADEPTGALDSKSSGQLLETFELLNRLGSTIVMVTHDAFTASWCHRIIFIKDGRLWGQLRRQNDTRDQFFARIVAATTRLGGEVRNAG